MAQLSSQEERLHHQDDYLVPVFLTTLLAERELVRLVAEPARQHAGHLIDALLQRRKTYKTSALAAWESGRLKATMGLVGQILRAMRWGLGQGNLSLLKFLADTFSPEYPDLVSNRQLEQALDRVRTVYRNPACHGTARPFAAADYADVARLVVGRDRIADWLGSETLCSLPAGLGVLDHHLRLRNQRAVSDAGAAHSLGGGTARRRVKGLSSSVCDRWRPTVSPRIAAGTRDLGAARDAVFRIGDRIVLEVEVRAGGHLTLIDFGTSGRAWALCPSNLAAGRLHPGVQRLPDPGAPLDSLVLSGRPGDEQLTAIVTESPLSLGWTPHAADVLCTELCELQFERLLEALAHLHAADWAVAHCRFHVEE